MRCGLLGGSAGVPRCTPYAGETMVNQARDLTKQVAVRLEPDLLTLLQADADRNGRNVAQSIRHYLKLALVAEGEGV